jgi:hypothetical protein
MLTPYFTVKVMTRPGWPLLCICTSMGAAADWSTFAPGVTPEVVYIGPAEKPKWKMTGTVEGEKVVLLVEQADAVAKLPNEKEQAMTTRL